MKRILQIIGDGNPGGGTTHVLQLINHFSNNCKVGIISQTDSYILSQADESVAFKEGINFSSLSQVLHLRKTISAFNPDLIHVHGTRAAFFYSLTGLNFKAIYTVHGYHFRFKPLLQKWIYILLERFYIRRYSKVVFVCKHDQKIAERNRFTPLSQEVIYNGIKAISPVTSKPYSSKIGFIGRLSPEKNVHFFIDVVKECPSTKITIIGGGQQFSEVQSRIKDESLNHISLLGYLSHDKTLEKMRDLDLIIMPSLWEGFPILLLEAMSLGIPIIAQNVGGISEMIRHENEGLLLENFSAAEYHQAIQKIAQDDLFRKHLIQNARARFESNFTEEIMFEKIGSTYTELLNS